MTHDAALRLDQPLRSVASRGLLWRIAAILVGSWLIALSARINVPMVPVPMSMQTFAILLIAVMAGRDLAGQTLLAYLAQGAAGLPMFASGAGLAYMAGPTGGYLAGFLVAALVVGALADRGWNRSALLVAGAVLIGHAIIFALGVGWLTVLMGSLPVAIANGLTPFVPGTIVKTALVVAVLLATTRSARGRGA